MNDLRFDAPDAALVTIDEQGIVVELDEVAEQVFGLSSEEARGRPVTALMIPRALDSPHWIFARRPSFDDPAPRFARSPASSAEEGAGNGRVEIAIGSIGARQARLLASGLVTSEEDDAEVEQALGALLEQAEGIAQVGSWAWNRHAGRLVWSDNLYRIFGLEPGEIEPSQRTVLESVHPRDRERVESAMEAARLDGLVPPLEYRVVRPDGSVRHVRATQALVEQAEGEPRRLVGSVQDITDRRLGERTIAAHLAVAESITEWRSFEQGATGLLRNLVVALDGVVGVLWVPEGDVLVAQVIWRSGSTGDSELDSVIRQLRLPRGVGLAGQVWDAGEPRHVPSLADDPRYPSEAVAGLSGAVALPAIHAGEVLAVLELHLAEPTSGEAADRLLRSLTSIGHELGEFLVHRRGELKPSALTPRELEVLQLAAEGCGGREIAERLVVSLATVRTHFEHIYEKYGVSDRASAVAKALRDGAID